jgi:hypothetical protein
MKIQESGRKLPPLRAKGSLLNILPIKIGNLISIRKLTWRDFPGRPSKKLTFSAHIFWHIYYSLEKGRISNVSVEISPNSWVRKHRRSEDLLAHEQGHYIIGCLCAMEFLRRVHNEQGFEPGTPFEDNVRRVFAATLKEYQALEKLYDTQTDHRLDFKEQARWNNDLYQEVVQFIRLYQPTKNRFTNAK